MAQSSAVTAKTLATAAQYNNLRNDVLSTTLGHFHDGTNGREHGDGNLLLRNPADTFSYTIKTSAIVAARNLTIPLLTGDDTLAVLGLAQTFSVLQTFSAGIDLNNASAGIVNVGAAGNDWTQNALTLSGGTSDQILTVESTGAGGASRLDLAIPASGTDVAMIRFKQGSGNGDANNMMYTLAYHGSNGYWVLTSEDSDGVSTQADIWRVTDGQTTIDANTTWDDNVFDSYDDAMLLSPYREGRLSLQERRAELIQMGVLKEYPDGWIGYNDQRMAALLAGGIYQNRHRIDRQYEEINRRLKALGG